ncbi:MAG: hypothetical protein R3E54_06615 [Halioglobus sp.]
MTADAEALADEALEGFYAETGAAYQQAAERCGSLQRRFRLAGRALQLEFAGPAMLANVVPALEHLSTAPAGEPALRVRLFDSASTGVALPKTPWGSDVQVARSEILGLDDSHAVRLSLHPGSAVLTLYHAASATALVWMADARDCPYWEAAAPLRGLLHWWCAAHGQQLVHAAAIGSEHAAMLLTGKGGSGKSTTALAGLLGGLRYLGDDYVVCENGAGGPAVHSLYNTAKVDRSSLALLPSLAGAIDPPPPAEQDKAVLYTARRFPRQLAQRMPLRALVVPAVTGGQPRLTPMSRAAAFLALAPTTLFQLPGAGRQTTAFLRELVTALPCYQLSLGGDQQALLALLRATLAEQA